MAKFKVSMAEKSKDYSFTSQKDGSEVSMVEYQIATTDEAGVTKMGMISRSAKKDAPKSGDELIGEWVNSDKFGWQFKEERQGGSNFAGGRGGGKSQEERNEIMAEKAVAEAALFLIGRGNYLLEMFKLNFATEAELKLHLKAFSKAGIGALSKNLYQMYKEMSAVEAPAAAPAASQPAEPAETPVEPTPGKMPNDKPEQNIDPSEIPF